MGHPTMGPQGSGQFYPGKGPAHSGMTLANSQAPVQQESNGMPRPSTPKYVKAEEEKLKNQGGVLLSVFVGDADMGGDTSTFNCLREQFFSIFVTPLTILLPLLY